MIILKSEWYNYQLSSLSFENVFVIYECDLCRKARTMCYHLRKGYVFHSHDPDFPSICFRSLAQWGPPHSATCCCGGVTGIQEVYAFLTGQVLIEVGLVLTSYDDSTHDPGMLGSVLTLILVPTVETLVQKN